MQTQRARVASWALAAAGMLQLGGLVDCRGQSELVETNGVPNIKVSPGYKLFDHNCAHCHGDDARGDEGPDLHGLIKSDARLEKIIKDGIKGEMPAFGKKFSNSEVRELIGYLRMLN